MDSYNVYLFVIPGNGQWLEQSPQARRFLVSIWPWVGVVYQVSLTLFSKHSGWFYTFHTRHDVHLLVKKGTNPLGNSKTYTPHT